MQKEVEVEEPKESDLYRIGCIATVKQIVKLPGKYETCSSIRRAARRSFLD